MSAQDFTEAAKWYRMAAEQDCADAQNKLIVGIQSGRIDPLDSEAEWKWYLREEKSRLLRRFGRARKEAKRRNKSHWGFATKLAWVSV